MPWEFVTDPFVRDSDEPAGKISGVHDEAPESLATLAQSLKTSALEQVAVELDTRLFLEARQVYPTISVPENQNAIS